MKIVYTESAKSELERFHKNKQKQLEEIIKRNKYIFGDELIEITANDIREAEKKFFIQEDPIPRLSMTTLLMKIYLILGIGMTLAGIFYHKIDELLVSGSPIQRLLLLTGITLIVVSIIFNYYLKIRYERRKYFEQRYREYEDKLNIKDK